MFLEGYYSLRTLWRKIFNVKYLPRIITSQRINFLMARLAKLLLFSLLDYKPFFIRIIIVLFMRYLIKSIRNGSPEILDPYYCYWIKNTLKKPMKTVLAREAWDNYHRDCCGRLGAVPTSCEYVFLIHTQHLIRSNTHTWSQSGFQLKRSAIEWFASRS